MKIKIFNREICVRALLDTNSLCAKSSAEMDIKMEFTLSPLRHTWILDIDGTFVKHNGYKIDGKDSFLKGAKTFLDGLPKEDMIIILTSRTEEMCSQTEAFLRENGIRYDIIIYNVPPGERILINDDKPSGLRMCYAIELQRDIGLADIHYSVDEAL